MLELPLSGETKEAPLKLENERKVLMRERTSSGGGRTW